MTGITYEKCEYCGEFKEAEYVDIGIGYAQVTEGFCPNDCEYLDYLEKQESREDEEGE